VISWFQAFAAFELNLYRYIMTRTPAEQEDLEAKQSAGMKITSVTTTDADGKKQLNRKVGLCTSCESSCDP
jgi:hypothetical protein